MSLDKKVDGSWPHTYSHGVGNNSTKYPDVLFTGFLLSTEIVVS